MKRWYKCRCCYCGRRIAVKLNKDAFVNMSNPLVGNSCFHCVSEKSPARNGCDESAFKTKELRGNK